MSVCVSCLDIGTVTSRVGIAEVDNNCVVRMQTLSEITDLGKGLSSQTACFSSAAIQRVYTFAQRAIEFAKQQHAVCMTCTLTSAARDAKNTDELVGALQDLDLHPQVITGEQEAQVAFLGVAQDFLDQQILVVDSGGGSTEFAYGKLSSKKLDLVATLSVDMGARRLTDSYFSSCEQIEPREIDEAHRACISLLQEKLSGLPELMPATKLIAVGGSATSLVAVDKKLAEYDPDCVHLAELTHDAVVRARDLFAACTLEQRRHIIGLQPKRAEVILAGSICIESVLDVLCRDRCIVSEKAALFGLAVLANAFFLNLSSFVDWELDFMRL